MEKQWCVYILICFDKTLYTGCTNDIIKRIKTHQQGKGAKYTRSRLPVSLVYSENCSDKSEALKREYLIKQMSRKEKLKMISFKNEQ